METQDLENEQPRPPLLLILAVITILGSVFTIVGGLFLPEDFSGWSEGMPKSPVWVTALTMLAAVVKLGGAILLLLRRRIGFWVYLGGELLAVFLNFKTGYDLMNWSNEQPIAGMPIDPAIFALLLVGVMLLLSVIWVGGFASYLGRLR
jgi:hypothetical protein